MKGLERKENMFANLEEQTIPIKNEHQQRAQEIAQQKGKMAIYC